LVEGAAVQNLFLSLVLRGKDLMPMVTIKGHSLVDLIEAAD
jgi:hypothetical protein